MKKIIHSAPKFTRVCQIRRDQFSIVVPFCFDDSSMISVGG
jgi:hypothetical protein